MHSKLPFSVNFGTLVRSVNFAICDTFDDSSKNASINSNACIVPTGF